MVSVCGLCFQYVPLLLFSSDFYNSLGRDRLISSYKAIFGCCNRILFLTKIALPVVLLDLLSFLQAFVPFIQSSFSEQNL